MRDWLPTPSPPTETLTNSPRGGGSVTRGGGGWGTNQRAHQRRAEKQQKEMEGLLREHFGLPTWPPGVAQPPAQLITRLQVVKTKTGESKKEPPRCQNRTHKGPSEVPQKDPN